jgi:hypothetical protein
MPTWAITNLTKGHVRRQMVRFLLPLLSFCPQCGCGVLLLTSALSGIPLLDQSDGPGIGGGRQMSGINAGLM